MVVLHMGTMELPFVVYWDIELEMSFSDLPDGAEEGGVVFTDEDGNALGCKDVDALSVAIYLARGYAAEVGKLVWSENVLVKATDAVMAEFGGDSSVHEDCSSASGSHSDEGRDN